MKTLAIDVETFSSIDLIKCGVYAYTSSPDFEILLFAYSFDDEEVKVIDIASGENLSDEVVKALTDDTIVKIAYNANFERTCLLKYLGYQMPSGQWQCTAVQSGMLGLPLSLDGVAQVLELEQQKMKEGKDLLNISQYHVSLQKLMVNELETYPVMNQRNGRYSKIIVQGML